MRKLTIEASDRWKTGELYRSRPAIMTDLTDGTRFLDWQAVCGKATPGEANDLRLVLHGWQDGFTPIDGLSQKARAHKYGVLLVSLVNLPLRIRHYADHVLLLALYNERCAATHTHAHAHTPTPPPHPPYAPAASGTPRQMADSVACSLALVRMAPSTRTTSRLRVSWRWVRPPR